MRKIKSKHDRVRRDNGPGEPLEHDEDQKVPQKKIMGWEKTQNCSIRIALNNKISYF